MVNRETVQEVIGLPFSDSRLLMSKIMQLLTTARQETYREILEDGLNDTYTHLEWVAFLERGAGVHGESH